MVIAPRHIINLDKATRLVLNLAALLARRPNLLVVLPDIITNQLTAATLNKDTAADTVRLGPAVAGEAPFSVQDD